MGQAGLAGAGFALGAVLGYVLAGRRRPARWHLSARFDADRQRTDDDDDEAG